MRLAWLLAIGFLIAGCSGNDSPIARAAGSWPGRFEIESVDGKTDPRTIDAEAMKGNLELYLTKMMFKLDMASKHQQFAVTGKWTAAKGRIMLTTDNVLLNNPREEDQKALSLRIVAPDEVRAALAHPVVLDESPNKRKLTGLKTSLGKLIGRFEFERPIPR